MKVLYVVSATQVTGGGSKSFLNLLHGVIHHRVEPLVVCPDQGKMYQDLQKEGIKVEHGIFGAHMKVSLLNDGPVTIMLESDEKYEKNKL